MHYNYHRSYSATTGRYTQSDPIGLDGGWNRFVYAELNPLEFTDPLGLDTIYNVNGVVFYANPGPVLGAPKGALEEHGRLTGRGYHYHTSYKGVEGPRVLSETGKIYPGDEKFCVGKFKDAIDGLKEGEKKYLDRATKQVFIDKKVGNRLLNARVRLQGIRASGFNSKVIRGLE